MKKQNTSEIYRTMFGKFFLAHTNMPIFHLSRVAGSHTPEEKKVVVFVLIKKILKDNVFFLVLFLLLNYLTIKKH